MCVRTHAIHWNNFATKWRNTVLTLNPLNHYKCRALNSDLSFSFCFGTISGVEFRIPRRLCVKISVWKYAYQIEKKKSTSDAQTKAIVRNYTEFYNYGMVVVCLVYRILFHCKWHLCKLFFIFTVSVCVSVCFYAHLCIACRFA